MSLRLAFRDFRVSAGPMPQKPGKYLLRALFAYFHHFKEPLFGSQLALALLLATSPFVFASGKQDLGREKWWGPGRRLGVTTFSSKMVGPRLKVGGNDFVVPTVLRPEAPERKQIPLLAKADEQEVTRNERHQSAQEDRNGLPTRQKENNLSVL